MALAPEEGEIIANHIRKNGVNLLLGHEITEVKTDTNSRVSAVRECFGSNR